MLIIKWFKDKKLAKVRTEAIRIMKIEELIKLIQKLENSLESLQSKIGSFNFPETKQLKYLNTKEAAEILGVCQKTLLTYCKEGKINFYQPERKYFFKVQDLEDFISSFEIANK